MTDFKPITIGDHSLLSAYLMDSGEQDCDFSFANLYCWHFMTHSAYALVDEQLVIRFRDLEGKPEYFMPLGMGNLTRVIEELGRCAQAEGVALCLRGVSPAMQTKLEMCFPAMFDYSCDRDYYDYIYSRQDLVELSGKNYQPKRNHVNRFRKEYAYTYESLTGEAVDECLTFEAEWCMKHGYVENENIRNERRAMECTLRHMDTLGVMGAVIRVEGRLVAFTYGAPINRETFGVHCEKADISAEGAYSMINREFVAHLPEQYVYLNREEDLGIPGLRQAKLSYHPVVLLEKCKAIKKA